MKYQISDFEDDRLGGIWHFLAVRLYTWQTAGWLQADVWNHLATACWTTPTLCNNVAVRHIYWVPYRTVSWRPNFNTERGVLIVQPLHLTNKKLQIFAVWFVVVVVVWRSCVNKLGFIKCKKAKTDVSRLMRFQTVTNDIHSHSTRLSRCIHSLNLQKVLQNEI